MRRRWSWTNGMLLLGAVMAAAGCTAAKNRAAGAFEPLEPGVFTVASDLPAPGFWNGDDPAGPIDGFEWALADALARRFDLTLRVVDVPFEQIEAGDLGGADLALTQLSATDERRSVLTLSAPYYSTAIGVIVPAGASVVDLKQARELRWAVRGATTEADFLDDVVRPSTAPVIVATESDAAVAVLSGQVEAALMDLVTALVITGAESQLTVTAAFSEPQHYVVALPTGTDNLEVVDQALKALAADGSLTRFEQRWLDPVFERHPSEIRVIRAR